MPHKIEKLLTDLKLACSEVVRFTHGKSINDYQKDKYLVGYGLGIILMCAMKVGRPDLYKSLGKGKAPHKEVAQIFKQVADTNHASWLFFVYLGGFTDLSPAYKILHSTNLLPEDPTEESIKKETVHIASAWGHRHQDRYPQIYALIESAELK